MFFAVVLTANHFIIDAVFGAIVSFAGLGIAWLLHRYVPPAWTRLAGRLSPTTAPVAAGDG